MASRINADSSNGLQLVSDSSGEVQIQANGITKAQVTSDGLINQDNVVISNRPIVVAKRTSSVTLTSATWTKVALNTTDIDTDSAFDTTNNKFTVPTGKAGKYVLNASTNINSLAAANLIRSLVAIRKNGTEMRPRFDADFNNNYVYSNTPFITLILDLADGDEIELWAWAQDSSGSPQYETGGTCLSIYKLIG